MHMKKILLIVALGLLALVGFGVMSFISVNNTLVTMEEDTKSKWSQVENVYQRRADLIPNLVATVKGYAKHEQETLENVARARASAGQVKVNDPSDITKFTQAQGDLTTALSRLMTIVEKYPELKADRGFMELQSQLEGTENRITIERRNFNEAAQLFNTYIRKFPQTLVASMRGFRERAYFEAESGAKTAPKVDFK